MYKKKKSGGGGMKKNMCMVRKKELNLFDKHSASGCEQKESPKQFLPSCGQSHNHAVGKPETNQPSLFGLDFVCSLEDKTFV